MRFTPLTVLLAAAMLAALPAAAQQQPGGGRAGSARPARPVDECGTPVNRPRRQRPRRPAAGQGQPAAPAAGTRAGHPEGAAPGAATAAPGDGAASASAGRPNGDTPASTASAGQASGTAAAPGSTSATQPNGQGGTAASPPSATAREAPNPASSGSLPASPSATAAADSPLARPAPPGDPAEARRNRELLRLDATALDDAVRLGPAASVSIPTAFGVDAGELFFGIAYQGRTRYTEQDDAAAVAGFGMGTRRLVALEASLTTFSTVRGGGPLETGGISVKLHRALPGHTSVAVGWENAVHWGGSDDDGSLYAAATRLLALRADPSARFSTAVVTLGVGNGRFRFESDDAEDNATANVFGALGVRVSAPLSVVVDWTGQDLNAAASITPFRRVPLVITAGAADLAGEAGDGARFLLSLGYGLALRNPF